MIALVAAAVAVTTWGFGWLAVPAIGLVVGAARISPRPIATAAAASPLGWAALLAWRAAFGPVGALADLLGQIVGAPGAALVGLTLVYPALLAGSAAAVGSGLRGYVESRRR